MKDCDCKVSFAVGSVFLEDLNNSGKLRWIAKLKRLDDRMIALKNNTIANLAKLKSWMKDDYERNAMIDIDREQAKPGSLTETMKGLPDEVQIRILR